MRLELGEAVASEFKSTFTCAIEVRGVIHGEDRYKTIEIPIQPHLVGILEDVLAKVKEFDDCKYHEVPGIQRFFRQDPYACHSKLLEDWPFYYDGGYYWTYDEHHYFWYDSRGKKHHAHLVI
jgi:hypothetical protein